MGSKHCVGSGGRVEPGQGCVGPEGPERLAQRARPSGSGWSEIAGIGSGAKGCQELGPRGPVGRLGPTATVWR